MALHDCVRGEPADVVIGDFLAEMTMGKIAESLIKSGRQNTIQAFYAAAFLKQVLPELEVIADRGLKVVVNAGAFNPAGMAGNLRRAIAERGLSLRVAHIEGDNLLSRAVSLSRDGQLANMDTSEHLGEKAAELLAANAYLGGWGIAAALEAGADIIIAGRVADASLVTGPAAWWHKWSPEDFDRLASACAAGHVIECGPQAVGGNFSGFREFHPQGRLGFPVAEISEDGTTVFSKRSGDEGIVTVDTVTAQLYYEIQGPCYLNPDVIVHFDTIQLLQEGPDRVRMTGVKGSPPPRTTKVACFYADGVRTLFFLYVTGLDWKEKCAWLRRQMSSVASDLGIDQFHFDVLGQPCADPASQAEATVAIRIAAAASTEKTLKAFTAAYPSFALGGIPGYYGDTMEGLLPRVEFWPGLVRQTEVDHVAVLEDGRRITALRPEMVLFRGQDFCATPARSGQECANSDGEQLIELGQLVHARSGDKGANANLGVWCREARLLPWLNAFLTEARLKELMGLPETMEIERYPLPNLNGIHFVIRGYFGRSGAGHIGLDQIGKAAGEFLRSRLVSVPSEVIGLVEGHAAFHSE